MQIVSVIMVTYFHYFSHEQYRKASAIPSNYRFVRIVRCKWNDEKISWPFWFFVFERAVYSLSSTSQGIPLGFHFHIRDLRGRKRLRSWWDLSNTQSSAKYCHGAMTSKLWLRALLAGKGQNNLTMKYIIIANISWPYVLYSDLGEAWSIWRQPLKNIKMI